MPTRREFIKNASLSAPLISLVGSTPAFLPNSLYADELPAGKKILVVVELDGGNDGINTIVPFADDGYGRNRKTLRIEDDRLIKINDDLAFNRSLRRLSEIYDEGEVAIVQGVGYPNPNRSHFRSMDIWHSGVTSDEHSGLGWLGKAFDSHATGAEIASMSVGPRETPLALRGRRSVASSIQSIQQFKLRQMREVERKQLLANPVENVSSNALQFARRTQVTALETLKQLSGANRRSSRSSEYPRERLGSQLSLVADLIRADLSCKAYYVQQSGYDTHAHQFDRHADLLRTLSQSLWAFQRDMRASGLADRVIVMAFSEFGRRVKENGAQGTDHGTAGPVLLMGSSIRGGIHGQTPDLSDLESGDLKMSVDFRSVYSTILEDWLSIAPSEDRKEKFPKLNLC